MEVKLVFPKQDTNSAKDMMSMYSEEDMKAIQANLYAIREEMHRLMLKGRHVVFHKKNASTYFRCEKSLLSGTRKMDLTEELLPGETSTVQN